MVESSFESPGYLVKWAVKETNNLKAKVEEFFAQDDLLITFTDFDSETRQNIIKVKFVKALPDDLRGIASNVMKNLRDALDQTTYAATKLIRLRATNRAHFPFGESPDDLEESLSKRRAVPCKGLAEELFPVLRRCQPYPTSDAWLGGNDNLRKLGRISGSHKHGVTLRVSAGLNMSKLGPGYIKTGKGGAALLIPPIWDSGKNELQVATFPEGGYFETNATISMNIVFGAGTLENVVAVDLLLELCATVDAIFEQIKIETLRIMDARVIPGHR